MAVDFFGTFPALHPGWIILIYVIVPWIPIAIGVHFIAHETSWKGGKIYSYICNLILFLYRFAPVIVTANVFWSGVILINQASYAYRNMSLNRNPNYFLSVDLTSFNALNAITSVTIGNSYNAITEMTDSSSSRRRLQTASAVDSTLTLVYHTNSFDDLVTANTFQQLCQIELSILNDNSSCINRNNYRYDSILTQYYNLPTDCVPTKIPINFFWGLLSEVRNSRFVSDSMDLIDPSTSVILSYFDVGTCAEDFTPKQFSDYLQQFTNDTNIQITFANDALNRQDIDDSIEDGGYYLMLSAIVCEIILIVALRGFIMSLMTMFCFFFALINAASFLPTIGFDYFSALNLGTFLILMAYGSSIAIMFASAWRRQVKPAAHPTVANIVNAYGTIGLPFLYLTMLGMICCFCLLVSPVIIVQQFGAFTGFSILFYYLIFHYVFLPTWIFTSWFIFSKKTHRKLRQHRSICCPWYDPIVQYFKAQKGWTTAAIIAEFVPDMDDDDDFIDDEDDMEDEEVIDRQGVVHASEVQILDRHDTTMSMHQRMRQDDPDNDLYYEEEEENMGDGSVRGRRFPYSRANLEDETTEYDETGEEIIESSVNGSVRGGGGGVGRRSRPDLTPIREDVEENRSRSVSQATSFRGSNGVTGSRSIRNLDHASSVINPEEVVAAAAPINPEDEPDPATMTEMQPDTNFCRGKRPLKLFGFVVLIMVIIGILIVYIISIQKFRLDLGLENMIHEDSSNLGYQYQIIEDYKYDLMNSHQSNIIPITSVPTRAPTRAPLSLRPTRSPTPFPTLTPTSGTRAPSRPPTTADYVDYIITGCWGIDYDEANDPITDREVTGTYSFNQFQQYVSNGLVPDMSSLCQYVNDHQISLDIHPNWDVNRDCIYYQYLSNFQTLTTSPRTVNDGLLAWAQTNYLTGSLLGLGGNGTSTEALPVWVCANFSIRSYINSVGSDPQYLLDLEDTWRETFQLYSINARRQGIPMQLSSPMFTYPLLSHQQQIPITIAIAAIVVGFTGLLWLLTFSDYGLTIFGALTIFTCIIIILCIHLFIQNSRLDVFDYIVVVSIVLLISHLPIQLIEEYQQARRLMDQQQMVRADKALSPALALTNKYFRQSVILPVLLLIMISIAPLYARFEILRRTASYIIIVAIVCLVMTVCFEPYLLAFGCRTKHCEALCYVEVDEDREENETTGRGSRPVIRHESSVLDQSPEQPTEIIDDDRRSNLSRSTNRSGSRYRSGRLTRPPSNASVSTHNSRQYSIDSRQSAGVMSLYGGSVNSGMVVQQQPTMGPNSGGSFYRAPMNGTPQSYYGAGVAATGDPDYNYSPPPPQGPMMNGSMYYPGGGGVPPGYPPQPPIGHPLALPRYNSSPDPRILMQQPHLLQQYPQPPPPPSAYYSTQAHDPYLFRAARQTPPTHPMGGPGTGASSYRLSNGSYYGSSYGGMNAPNHPQTTAGSYPLYPGQHPSQYPSYHPQSRPYSTSTQSRVSTEREEIPVATVTAIVPVDDHDAERRSMQM